MKKLSEWVAEQAKAFTAQSESESIPKVTDKSTALHVTVTVEVYVKTLRHERANVKQKTFKL